MRSLVTALVVAILLTSPATAQSGPIGIAFAQAAEGTWWCQDGDPDEGFACALDKCRGESGGQECHPTRWCLPAGWSGLMTVWLPEFHNTVVLCGTSGEAAVIAGLQALCDNSPFITRCTPFAMIDPDGNERSIDDLDWPGPAIREPETSEQPEPEASQ
jgi:hypothetical protein